MSADAWQQFRARQGWTAHVSVAALKRRAGNEWAKLRWAVWRGWRLFGWRVIERLIRYFRWHNTVLGTTIPNVPGLKIKSIVLVNQYGQEHCHAAGMTMHRGFAGDDNAA